MPNGCQDGAKIDAKTHQKSMPKLVKKKIMNMVNSFKCIEKTNIIKVSQVACANGKGIRKTLKMMQHPSQHQRTIDTNFMLEKVMRKTRNSFQND